MQSDAVISITFCRRIGIGSIHDTYRKPSTLRLCYIGIPGFPRYTRSIVLNILVRVLFLNTSF